MKIPHCPILAGLLSTLLLFAGCTRSSGDLNASIRFHKQNRATLDSAVAAARNGFGDDTMRRHYPALCAEGYDCSRSPFVVEFAPIDYYYVLVFADDETALMKSSAIQDEGTVKRRLGNGWYVVQRGFM
jgi:hypothetical protein